MKKWPMFILASLAIIAGCDAKKVKSSPSEAESHDAERKTFWDSLKTYEGPDKRSDVPTELHTEEVVAVGTWFNGGYTGGSLIYAPSRGLKTDGFTDVVTGCDRLDDGLYPDQYTPTPEDAKDLQERFSAMVVKGQDSVPEVPKCSDSKPYRQGIEIYFRC